MGNGPNEMVKRMLFACIMVADRQELVLLYPTGLAYDNYGTGDFFMELLKEISNSQV